MFTQKPKTISEVDKDIKKWYRDGMRDWKCVEAL